MNLTKTIETEYASITPEKVAELKARPFPKEFPRALHTLLNEVCPQDDTFEGDSIIHDYTVSLAMIKVLSFDYTPEDITAFSLALSPFEEHEFFSRSGIFLSALINLHQEKTKTTKPYVLVTDYLEKKIDNLCIKNSESNIQIIGDCGYHCGFKMESGTIIVEGSTGYGVGHKMYSGNIEIKKNTKKIGGQDYFSGGKITVYGDKPEIDIFGWIEMSVGKTGEIYHREKKIFP